MVLEHQPYALVIAIGLVLNNHTDAYTHKRIQTNIPYRNFFRQTVANLVLSDTKPYAYTRCKDFTERLHKSLINTAENITKFVVEPEAETRKDLLPLAENFGL